MIIRPAAEADLGALASLAATTFEEANRDSTDPADLEAIVRNTRSREYFDSVLGDDDILLLEDDGRPIGYAQFGDVKLPLEREFRAPRDQYLERLYVLAQYHGRGLGRRLLRAALTHPRLAAAANVWLNVWSRNATAIGLYESEGFRVVDQYDFHLPSGETGDPELVMMRERWTARVDDVAGGQRYVLSERDVPLSVDGMLRSWGSEPAFADWYSDLLASSAHEAFFWENPPLERGNLERQAEFVLLDAPALARMAPEPESFHEHFRSAMSDIAVFPNLGGDAMLVAPVPSDADLDGTHLATFLRSAPPGSRARLWQAVAGAVQEHLGPVPLWLSTSGTGVGWLHVRLDRRPKYYQHRPYRAASMS